MAGRSKANLHLNYPEGLRGTSLEAKVLYTRLLCDDALNHAGILPLRIALWADECEMSEGDIDKALRELEDKRYAYTDYKTHQVLVRTLVRNDGIADMPNVLWSACRCALNLRSPKLRRVLAGELRKLAPKPPDKISEKTGKRYVYPDPHGTADAIDPGPPEPSEGSDGTLRRTLPGSLPNPSEGMPRDAGTPGGGGGGGGKSSVGLSSSSVGAAKRGTRIPDDFTVTPAMIDWARQHTPLVGQTETDLFVEYWQSESGAKATKIDWVKAWQVWMRREQKSAERRPGQLRVVPPPPTPSDPAAAFDDLRHRGDAQQAANLIGATWREPAKPPSDPTPTAEWMHHRRVEFIDLHADRIRAALQARKAAG